MDWKTFLTVNKEGRHSYNKNVGFGMKKTFHDKYIYYIFFLSFFFLSKSNLKQIASLLFKKKLPNLFEKNDVISRYHSNVQILHTKLNMRDNIS